MLMSLQVFELMYLGVTIQRYIQCIPIYQTLNKA